jgi:hypothetical protein
VPVNKSEGDVSFWNGLIDLQKKSPEAAARAAKAHGIEKLPVLLPDGDQNSTAQRNKLYSEAGENFFLATPEEQARRIKEIQDNGGDPTKVLAQYEPLADLDEDEAYRRITLNADGTMSPAGNASMAEIKENWATQQRREAEQWLAEQVANTPAGEQSEKWQAGLDAEVAKRRAMPMPSSVAEQGMRERFKTQFGVIRSILRPESLTNRVNTSPQGKRFTSDGHELLPTREPQPGGPLQEDAAPSGLPDSEKWKELFQKRGVPAGGGEAYLPPPPQDAFTVASQKFAGVVASLDSPESQPQNLGWDPKSRDESDFIKQKQRVTGLQAQVQAKRSGQHGAADRNLIKEYIKEVDRLEEMAGRRTQQPTMQQRAESETYAMPDGMRMFIGPTGEWKSIMPPKSNVQVETQRMQLEGQLAQEQLEFQRQKHEFDRQRFQDEIRQRGEDRGQKDDQDLRNKIFDLSTQPAEPIPRFAPSEILPGEGLGESPYPQQSKATKKQAHNQQMQAGMIPGIDPFTDGGREGNATAPVMPFGGNGMDSTVGNKKAVREHAIQEYARQGNPFAVEVMKKLVAVEDAMEANGQTYETLPPEAREQIDFLGEYIRAIDKGDPVQVKTPEQARQLPAGTRYLAPDGKLRIR